MPLYFISTVEDHIAPWKSTYAGARLFGGPVRFVLGGSGHIAGIVNPPAANKYGYWTNDALAPAQPDEWLEERRAAPGLVVARLGAVGRAARRRESAGARARAPAALPAIEDAPGLLRRPCAPAQPPA